MAQTRKLTYIPCSPSQSSPRYKIQSWTQMNFDIFSSYFTSSKFHATGEQIPEQSCFLLTPNERLYQHRKNCTTLKIPLSTLQDKMPCWCLCSAQGCTSRQAVHTSHDCLGMGSKSHCVYVGKSMSELSMSVSLPKYTESLVLWSHSNIYSIYLPLWHDCWKEGAGALLCLDPVMEKSPPGYLVLLPAITSHRDIWKGQWQFHAVASFPFKKRKKQHP